jgi:uncharacterized protein involved in exopolysaccharide biosynthesis
VSEHPFDEAAREFARSLDRAREEMARTMEEAKRHFEAARAEMQDRLAEARDEFAEVMGDGRAALQSAKAEFEKEFAAARARRKNVTTVEVTRKRPPRKLRRPDEGEPAPVEPKPRPTNLSGGAEAPLE